MEVAFDTNQGGGDPSVPYVGVNLNGNYTSAAHSPVVPFANGSTWSVWVTYDGTTLSAFLTTGYVRPASPAVQLAVNIATTIGAASAYIGLGGGTGGESEVLTLFDWEYVSNGAPQFRYGWDHCYGVSPCENGGTCVNGLTSSTCQCVLGFVGAHCEVEVNNCLPNICENGGTCTNGVNTFACTCPEGFTGLNCQASVRMCDTSPCANGGTCVNTANDYLCLCPPDYSDSTCGTRKRAAPLA